MAFTGLQIKNILAPSSSDSSGAWRKCKLDMKACSSAQSQTIQGTLNDVIPHEKYFKWKKNPL